GRGGARALVVPRCLRDGHGGVVRALASLVAPGDAGRRTTVADRSRCARRDRRGNRRGHGGADLSSTAQLAPNLLDPRGEVALSPKAPGGPGGHVGGGDRSRDGRRGGGDRRRGAASRGAFPTHPPGIPAAGGGGACNR